MIIAAIAVWIVLAVCAWNVARNKGRDESAWLVGTLILPVSILVLLALPSATRASDDKVCPDCGETIKAVARVCRYCRHDFAPLAPPGPIAIGSKVRHAHYGAGVVTRLEADTATVRFDRGATESFPMQYLEPQA